MNVKPWESRRTKICMQKENYVLGSFLCLGAMAQQAVIHNFNDAFK